MQSFPEVERLNSKTGRLSFATGIHFELLIAVILSAQATDVSVNKVTPELFSAFPTPEEMFEAGSEKIFDIHSEYWACTDKIKKYC